MKTDNIQCRRMSMSSRETSQTHHKHVHRGGFKHLIIACKTVITTLWPKNGGNQPWKLLLWPTAINSSKNF